MSGFCFCLKILIIYYFMFRSLWAFFWVQNCSQMNQLIFVPHYAYNFCAYLLLFVYFSFFRFVLSLTRDSWWTSVQSSEGSFVRKSAASMLTGKKSVLTAVSFLLRYIFQFMQCMLVSVPWRLLVALVPFNICAQPVNKKGGSVKSGGSKKGDGPGQLKSSKLVEIEALR